jgi:hypothetical protein
MMLSAMQYPHWMMVAGAVLVVLGKPIRRVVEFELKKEMTMVKQNCEQAIGRYLFLIVGLSTLTACQDESTVYTLYRNSPMFASLRIHVATFDATESADYNRENCQTAADLFASQPGVKVRYQCEKGRYRP